MSIKQFIKPVKRNNLLFQARIDKDLYDGLRRRLREQKITHRQFTEAAIRQFIKED